MKNHYVQLRSLYIHDAHDITDYDGEVVAALTRGNNFALRFQLPLSCGSISCSPTLVPVFLPGSYITNVTLEWPIWDIGAVDNAATTTITALASTRNPVKSLSYITRTWNLEFIRLASAHLPLLETLELTNEDEDWHDTPNERAAYVDGYVS